MVTILTWSLLIIWLVSYPQLWTHLTLWSLSLNSISSQYITPSPPKLCSFCPIRFINLLPSPQSPTDHDHLTFADHINQLSRTCHMHIRDLCRLRPIPDYKTACTIATSTVHSKLHHCNSIFYSIDSFQTKCLQTIQNALTSAVSKTPKHHHITSVLKSHHWLNIFENVLVPTITTSGRPSYSPAILILQSCF